MIKREGSHTQRSSLLIAAKLHVRKKTLIRIMEIGCQGKKYRVVSKGDNRATPMLPFERASRSP
jgi:hypothetical protein